MKKAVMRYGVAAALALGLLMTAAFAVADEMKVINGSQREGVFTFELACLDDRHSPISDLNLTPSAWQVSVEGREPLPISDVRLNENAGVHYIVIAQSSVAMDNKPRKDMAEAVQSLIDGMSASDHMTLYRMDTDMQTLALFEANQAQLTAAAGQLSDAGERSGQALYTALETALRFGREKADATAKTALIVFSDGYNTGKGVDMSTAEVMKLVGLGDVRVFTVLLQTSSTSDAAFLEAISDQTNGFLLRQKETGAKDAAVKIRAAIRKTVMLTCEDQNGAYSGLADDAWRILYARDGAVTLRAGYTLPIVPWHAAARADARTAVTSSETKQQPTVEPTSENPTEGMQLFSETATAGDTEPTATVVTDTAGQQGLYAPAQTETSALPAESTPTDAALEKAGFPHNALTIVIIGIFVAALLIVVAALVLRLRKQKENKKRQAENEALRGARNHTPAYAPAVHTTSMASASEPATAARVAPVVRYIPPQPLDAAPSPAQPIAKTSENVAGSAPNPYRMYPQSAGIQPTIAESPTVSEPDRAEYGNPRDIVLDQTVAETRFPSPLDQTVAETRSPSPLDQTIAETHSPSPLDQTIAETRLPSPLDQTVAEVLPPLPIDVTVDDKAFAAAGNAMADESAALRAAPGSRFERTFEGKPRGAGTPAQTKAAPTLYQQTTLLLTVRESGEERALQVPLDTGRAVWFGRDGDVQLNPHDQSISRRHFSITLTSSELRLKDNSPNGTKVDGLWIYKEERTIAAGCVITSGGEDQKPCEPTEIVIADIRVPGDWKAPNP